MTEWLVPLIWFIIAVLLILIEANTFNLVTIWFAIGAIATMFVSIFAHDIIWLQLIVFLATSILMVLTIRNYAVKKLKSQSIKTNVNSLIGKKAMVTEAIEKFKYGLVKVNGNYWTAKAETNETIDKGEIVEIIDIRGVKLIVRRENNNY